MKFNNIKTTLAASLFSITTPLVSHATVVQFQTNLGEFSINLYDETVPNTVDNFLAYINDDRYDNTIIHRAAEGEDVSGNRYEFILQGGGYSVSSKNFVWTNDSAPVDVETFSPVRNEPRYSNLRGTIAMAKTASSPHTATSQWFINLNDNSGNLDFQNGGFTVFGEVESEDMTVIDAIAALQTLSSISGLSSSLTTQPSDVFADIPLQNMEASDTQITYDNMVVVYDVIILDKDESSASDSAPTVSKNVYSILGRIGFADFEEGLDTDISIVYNEDITFNNGTLTASQLSAFSEGMELDTYQWIYSIQAYDVAFLEKGDEVAFSYTVSATNTDEQANTDTREATIEITITGTDTIPEPTVNVTGMDFTEDEPESSSSGGGSLNLLFLFALGLIGLRKYKV